MLSEEEVESALAMWKASLVAIEQMPEAFGGYTRTLAEGYVGALEMVLRGK